MTMTELCKYLKNYFPLTTVDGAFEIRSGSLHGMDAYLLYRQFFKIEGSALNDGVWQYGIDALTDEAFSGRIITMAVPPAILSLLNEINDWQDKYGEASLSPYTSESFGGYSYSKAGAAGGGDDGSGSDWRSVFGHKLTIWRKA